MKQHKPLTRPLLIIALVLLSTGAFSQDPNFYIYLCFGQSNMEGQGGIERKDKTVDERFKVMEAVDCSALSRTMGEWYTAVPPLCRCTTGFSPADYFGRTMVTNLPDSIKIGVINVSVAGCKIELFDTLLYQDYLTTVESWLTNIVNEYDGNPYQRLIDIARLAQKDGVIKGILMHQGESNTGESTWPAKVNVVYNNILNDLNLNADSVPLLAGEVLHGGLCASMNDIIAKLPQTIPTAHVVSSAGCKGADDKLHFVTEGYRELGRNYAAKMLEIMGIESVYYEAECATAGTNWDVKPDEEASNESYITALDGIQSVDVAPTDEQSFITFPFKASFDTTYLVYGRINGASNTADAFWMKLNDGDFVKYDNLTTTSWQWLELGRFGLTAGDQSLTVAIGENGVKLDKICIRNTELNPAELGDKAKNLCVPDTATISVSLPMASGFSLGQCFPNPSNGNAIIPFEIREKEMVSLKIYNITGVEIAELAGTEFEAGKHIVKTDALKLQAGNYFIVLKTNQFVAAQKMIVVNQSSK